jgi:ADP-ribose pyrophosphatase
MDWKLISATLEYNNFMQVEKRIYELPNGVTKDFDIKIGRDCACIFALTEDNKVIISREFRPGPGATLDELPGGVISLDKETPEEGAARELEEETGYTGDLEFVTEYFVDAYTTGRRFAFVATNCKRTTKQNLDYSEDITVKLKDLPEFIQQVRTGQLTDVAVVMLALDHLGLLGSVSQKPQ